MLGLRGLVDPDVARHGVDLDEEDVLVADVATGRVEVDVRAQVTGDRVAVYVYDETSRHADVNVARDDLHYDAARTLARECDVARGARDIGLGRRAAATNVARGAVALQDVENLAGNDVARGGLHDERPTGIGCVHVARGARDIGLGRRAAATH